MDIVVGLQQFAAFLVNASFSVLVGSLAARYWMVPQGVSWQKDATRTLLRLEPAVAGVGVLSCAAALWAACAVMNGSGLVAAVPMLWTMLTQTSYGHVSLAAMGALACVLALSLAAPGKLRDIVALLLLMVFALARAANSHAAEDGFASVSFVAEWLHLQLIGVWTGGVVLAACVTLNAAKRGAELEHYLDALSLAATIALAGILASGIYNAWQRVGTLDHLTGNPYGTALMVKLGLVLVAIVLGGYNKLAGFPGAARSDAMLARARLVLRIEAVLLAGALAAAAVLTVQQPPMAG